MRYFHLVLALSLIPFISQGQHEHHVMEMSSEKSDTAVHTMTHAFSRNLPMNRNGSGTGWMPDETPMYAWMKHTNHWNYMLHGAVFFRYNMQNLNNDYKRGGKQFDVPNWFMGMAQRNIGKKGLLLLRGMFSLDRLTLGGSGYPLLFQSGETWKDQRLIDKQHPHDLISELGIAYTHMIGKDVDVTAYVGYPGEPALGPTAFMHRISSMNNPDAPLGHHWQDASHITFGVATLGIRYKFLKAEASSFTGREPDENRYDFDKPRFDSYSYRISANPNKNLSLQFSQGKLKGPEALEPEEDVTRTTASALYSGRISDKRYLTGAMVWGYNNAGGHHKEHSFLLESNYQHNQWAIYGRAERIQKSSGELALEQFDDRIFNINAFTLGTNYTFSDVWRTNMAVGVQATFNKIENDLEDVYGKNPMSAELYLRVIPQLMQMQKHHH
jgi:hypothetical protein